MADHLTPGDEANHANWFTYHPPTPEQIPAFEEIREAGKVFADTIARLVPPSPDRTVAVRHVRDAVMNANASLACYPDGLRIQSGAIQTYSADDVTGSR